MTGEFLYEGKAKKIYQCAINNGIKVFFVTARLANPHNNSKPQYP